MAMAYKATKVKTSDREGFFVGNDVGLWFFLLINIPLVNDSRFVD